GGRGVGVGVEWVGEPGRARRPMARGDLAGERGALLEGAKRRPHGFVEDVGLLCQKRVARPRMADATSEACELTVLDFPQDSPAVGTTERGNDSWMMLGVADRANVAFGEGVFRGVFGHKRMLGLHDF